MKLLLINLIFFTCTLSYGQWDKSFGILNSTLFDVEASTDGIVYAVGTDSVNYYINGSIFKSIDGGDTWFTVNHIVDSLGIGSYMTRVNIIDSTRAFVSNRSPIVYRTTDAGLIWDTTHIPTGSGVITDAMHFLDNVTGFVGNHFGEIFKTIDGGLNWFLVHANPIFNPITDISCPTNSTCYARTSMPNKLLKSIDGGNSWNVMPSAPNTYITGGLHAINQDTVIMVTSDSLIFRSLDGGSSWDTIPCPVYSNLLDVFFIDNIGFAVGDLETILKSVDYGETWSVELHDSISSEQITSIHMLNNTSAIACSNLGSIYRLGGFNSVDNLKIEALTIDVYPNPFSENLIIHFSKHFSGVVNIHDALGRVVYTTSITNQNTVELNLSKIDSDCLYLRFTDTDSGQIITKKIIGVQ